MVYLVDCFMLHSSQEGYVYCMSRRLEKIELDEILEVLKSEYDKVVVCECKEIIDLAKQYITDMNGRTILSSGNLALRIDRENDKEIYVCTRIDGTDWKFDFFRQACAFHYIVSLIGFNDELLDEYYELVKCNIGSASKEELQLQQKLL